jgi:hypothetical protein
MKLIKKIINWIKISKKCVVRNIKRGNIMNKITVNGKTIEVSGNNISVINNKIFVDGKEISDEISKNADIYIYGDVGSIETDKSVNCDNVKGDIHAGGSVNCDDVNGSINCGGSVNCDNVGGSVTAGGSIRM